MHLDVDQLKRKIQAEIHRLEEEKRRLLHEISLLDKEKDRFRETGKAIEAVELAAKELEALERLRDSQDSVEGQAVL
ncbi:MAG: hypothetical protein ACE5JX_14600 [Acidobacteriota bacterium]